MKKLNMFRGFPPTLGKVGGKVSPHFGLWWGEFAPHFDDFPPESGGQ